MDLRAATRDDVEDIRSVARASLRESYGHVLDDETIDEAVEHWYDGEELVEDLTAEDAVFVVAVDGRDVVGFAQSYVIERPEPVGEIDWLHVLPDHRDRGLGTQLLKRVETALLEKGVERIEGRVLAANEEGAAFYDQHGFDRGDDESVEIGGETFTEETFAKYPEGADGSRVLVESRNGPQGQRLYIAYDESERGALAPFFVTYLDRDRQERYGWFCGNCDGFDTSMDTMGRIECTDCGNGRKASRWDAAYL